MFKKLPREVFLIHDVTILNQTKKFNELQMLSEDTTASKETFQVNGRYKTASAYCTYLKLFEGHKSQAQT